MAARLDDHRRERKERPSRCRPTFVPATCSVRERKIGCPGRNVGQVSAPSIRVGQRIGSIAGPGPDRRAGPVRADFRSKLADTDPLPPTWTPADASREPRVHPPHPPASTVNAIYSARPVLTPPQLHATPETPATPLTPNSAATSVAVHPANNRHRIDRSLPTAETTPPTPTTTPGPTP